MNPQPRILFITSNRIGDAVLTTGILEHLVRAYPLARLTIACGPAAADIFRATPRLDRLFILKKKKYHGHWFDFWRACFPVKWDFIIDMRNTLVSRLLFAERRAFGPGKPTGRHRVEDIAYAVDILPPPAPRLWIDKIAEARADSLLPSDKTPLLALGPAANWPAKQWSIYKFGLLAHKLIDKNGPLEGGKILLIAAPNERDQLSFLFDLLPRDKIIDLIGQDLITIAACLQRCRLFVGNDSGLMHIAAAAGTPTLGLFGPGYEKIYGPWGAKTAVARTPETSKELLARCPYAGAFYPNLMSSLSVENVFHTAQELLAKGA